MSQTDLTHDDSLLETAEKPAPKVRHCLRCQTEFESQWSGERVCSRCKGTAAWRAGSPAEGR